MPQDCEDVREIYGIMKDFTDAAAPGTYLADMIPLLASIIPERLQWWRAVPLKAYRRQETLWMRYWNSLKVQMDLKRAPECFVKQFLETDFKDQGITDVQGAFLAGCKRHAAPFLTPFVSTCVVY